MEEEKKPPWTIGSDREKRSRGWGTGGLQERPP
jgi:hypothetical protein